jgi:CubicO group peptidase (beta-lactamase class C family)
MNTQPVGYKVKAFGARKLAFLFLVIVLLLPACVRQPGSLGFDPDRVAQLDEILSRMAVDETFSGSILIAQDGEVLLSRGYGSADRELSISNTPQTRFRLGSITKQFTAMAILILQSQGRLNVQDPICRTIEDCPAAWEDITIHHLLTHTSGITPMVGNSGSLPITPDELIALIKDSPLDFQPGERFSYSNCGYWVLGYIIEQVSGQSYKDFIQQAIFEPLEMHDSGYDQDARGLAVGYKDQYTIATPSGVSDSSFAYSAGALYSTVEDLYRWDQALYTDKLIPRELLDQMFAPLINLSPDVVGSAAYGYGWIVQGDLGRQLVWHGGAIDGFRSSIIRYPDERITIILLSNQEDSPDTMYFSWRSLIFEMIAIETEDGTTITYAGPLEAQAGGELQVTFMVTDPSGQPAQGLLVGTLGEPPADSAAIRTSAPLSTDGTLTLFLSVDIPTGTTSLYCFYKGVEYKVTSITISP